jgi:hypothetical protein
MMLPRDQRKCPVCGDPGPFRFWVDNQPPTECPYNPSAKSVTDCAYQMAKARQDASRRKLVPECFDDNGRILPGKSAEMLTKWAERGGIGPDEKVVV